MKNLTRLLLCFSLHLHAQTTDADHSQKMNEIVVNRFDDTINIAILVYQDVVLQDFAGPMEVFSKAQKLTKGKYNTYTVSLDKQPITTEQGLLTITPSYDIHNMPAPDYLIVPGASMPVINELLNDQSLRAFITNINSTVVSICTASYLLANTGKLDEKKATTHYFVANDFKAKFPKVEVIEHVRFVDERDVITSSGITSGIDAALHVVEKNHGEKLRAMIARALQHTFKEKEPWPVAPNGMEYRGN
ncbi:DJ-1/PfpI family protein [Tunicatimonas pelagia]|uniref:DJ-1/PfpI family protein n=1 Tax=Tunicatimonas pelagia TaxID=931531 RepID=UPI00266681C5|nr:DJ-1/PfpI family protein [Tunicatimonas pelagia]WKN45782.1 DJ-1/PfpI family protein [Tunicatimonas pelagia]